jgi:hypothetical protein
MAINFIDNAFIEELALKGDEDSKPEGVSSSKNVTGIEVRLARAHILDNKTPKIGPFPGFSKLYLIVIVVSDKGEVLQTLDLKSFAKVDDNEDLPVDKTIYYWKQNGNKEKSPSQIHVLVSIVKSKQQLRDVSKIMTDVKNDDDFSDFVSSLKSIVKNTSAVSQIADLLFSTVGIVGKFLGKVDDKPLLTWVQSFTDINGDFDKLGKVAVRRGNKNADLELSVIIRDTTREVEIAKLENLIIEELAIDKNGIIA